MKKFLWRRHSDPFYTAAKVSIGALLPLVMFLSSIRLMASNVWLEYEYSRPSFPTLKYGLGINDRMGLGRVTVAYLNGQLNEQDLVYGGKEIYQIDEVVHLKDVKNLLEMVGFVHSTGIVLICVSVFILFNSKWQRKWIFKLFVLSGLATLTIVTVLAMLMSVAWDWFFVAFHQVFFSPGTWEFAADSMLIRQFPEVFWVDSGIAVIVLTAAQASVISLIPMSHHLMKKYS